MTVSCLKCKYRKIRSSGLVSGSGSGISASILETANEELRLDQVARKQEEERFLSGENFEFEPRFLPWCQRFTMAKLDPDAIEELAREKLIPDDWSKDLPTGASPLLSKVLNMILDGNQDADTLRRHFLAHNFDFVFDPALGKVRAVFALCNRVNRDANCSHFRPREPKDAL